MFNKISNLIDSSLEKTLPDIVFKNAKIIDVFCLEIIEGDIAVTGDIITGIGQYAKGKKTIDLNGKFVSPGLIDPHVHIESSLVTPDTFSSVLLEHGVTTIVTDPHEISNVLGKKGIQYMIDSTENTELDIFIMLPSCIPATRFESSGAILEAEDLKEFYSHPRVLGLAEMMNFPGIINSDEKLLKKISDAKSFNLTVDGHAPGITENELNAYILAGISTDHECETPKEMKIRLQRGMYVFIREGTVARNLEALIGEINYKNNDLICFCTDDKDLYDLVHEGSIDFSIRKAIKLGLDPLLAIKLSTINSTKAHGLHDRGAIAPGKKADLLILDDLENFTISEVYKNGKAVSKNTVSNTSSIHLEKQKIFLPENINWDIELESNKIRAIEIVPNNLYTNEKILDVKTDENKKFISDKNLDITKLFVIERHTRDNNNVGKALLHGLKIKKGAIASTIGHDSHNLLVAGYNDDDFNLAVKTIQDINGGLAVVSDGKVLASLSLEIAGLMTARSIDSVLSDVENLHNALTEIGFDGDFNPFLALAFLSLPVIPKLKLTDMGLFDVNKFEFVSIEI